MVRKPERIRREVDKIIGHLMEVGLSDDQNFAILRGNVRGRCEVGYKHADLVSVSMKDNAYSEIYNQLAIERSFSAKLLDGALIQIMYVFDKNVVERHRLGFFPSPYLREFQNEPTMYLEDDLFVDVVSPAIVPFPLRFDYDSRDSVFREIHHPKSHLTLGQYSNCRIPVSGPITPYWFVNFILRNFYHTAFVKYAEGIPSSEEEFEESIVNAERGIVHLQIPIVAH